MTCPALFVFSIVPGADDTKRFVEEAVALYIVPDAVMAVLDAYGKILAIDEVEVILPAMN